MVGFYICGGLKKGSEKMLERCLREIIPNQKRSKGG